MRRIPFVRPPLAVIALLLGTAIAARAESLVTVRAFADKAYAAKRAETSPPEPQSYVFLKGRYYAGRTQDRTLEQKPFIEVARTVAADLRRQGFVPTRNTKTADLLILVHWGVTDRIGRYAEINITTENEAADRVAALKNAEEAVWTAKVEGDERAEYENQQQMLREQDQMENLLRDIRSDMQATEWGASDNSALLGFNGTNTGNELFGSEKAATLKSMSQEERYFIIVTAYDFKFLRDTSKARVLWVARISTRAAGINFNMAVNRLSDIGGTVFGQNTDGLDFRRAKQREARIEYGELEVIGMK